MSVIVMEIGVLDISAFSIPENVKIDISKFKEIEFDIPIVNELEKYSDDELSEELLRRKKESPKFFVFCCRCKEPIYTKPMRVGGNHWYYCEHCNEIVLPIKD